MTCAEAAEIIARARISKGWSQRELASYVGVSHSYVSHVEAGRRMPSVETLNRIARGLGPRLVLEEVVR
jgi:transcriptional regulator with XRE-family HTH domain